MNDIKTKNKVGEMVSQETVSSMVRYAVVLAGGEGRRAGGGMPKQFRQLDGLPMLWWSVMAFHQENPKTKIYLVLHPGFFDDFDIFYDTLPEDKKIAVEVICGGRTRKESVANALMEIPADANSMVAVHDAARPLVTEELIGRGWECCQNHGTAVPAVAVTDSLRHLTAEGSEMVDRKDYVAVQTPQIFRADILKDAFQKAGEGEFTDDASVAEAAGYRITLFEGDPFNMKVTNPLDIDVASLLLSHRH